MNTLIVFTRPFGCLTAKTRLRDSAQLSKAATSEVHDQLLTMTLKEAKLASFDKIYIYWSEPPQAKKLEDNSLISLEAEEKIQTGDSFSERMRNCWQEVNSLHPNSKIVVVGSDCPDLKAKQLNQSIELLTEYDACVGPTPDENFYLLGLNHEKNTVILPDFTEIISSKNQIAAINRQYSACGTLESLQDLDKLSDLENMSRTTASLLNTKIKGLGGRSISV